MIDETLKQDLINILHILTTPPPKNESDAEWERILAWSSALSGWEHKYGDEVMDEIKSALENFLTNLTDKVKL